MAFSLSVIRSFTACLLLIKDCNQRDQTSYELLDKVISLLLPTPTIGPRHCPLLSHYWLFLKTPHSALTNLNESPISLISQTHCFTCVLYPWLLATSHLCSLNNLVPFLWNALQTCVAIYFFPKTRGGKQHIWLDSAAILETNYFSPSIQCQSCEKIISTPPFSQQPFAP